MKSHVEQLVDDWEDAIWHDEFEDKRFEALKEQIYRRCIDDLKNAFILDEADTVGYGSKQP